MRTQNKKAKVLNKRSQQVDNLFVDVEEKYSYCNLKSFSRRLLQPMLNEQWLQNNKQYTSSINQRFLRSQTIEEKEQQLNYKSGQTSEIVQSMNPQDYDSQIRKKLKRAIKKSHDFSLNDIIQRETIEKESKQLQITCKKILQIQNNKQIFLSQIDEEMQIEEEEELTEDKYEEYRGCSLNHSSKYVQQSLSFYEKKILKNFKELPKVQQHKIDYIFNQKLSTLIKYGIAYIENFTQIIQTFLNQYKSIEENVLIGRIATSDLVFKELKKVRNNKDHRIKAYLIQDFKEQEEMKKSQLNMIKNFATPIKNKILPDIYNIEDTEEHRDALFDNNTDNKDNTNNQYSNVKETQNKQQILKSFLQQKLMSRESDTFLQEQQYEQNKNYENSQNKGNISDRSNYHSKYTPIKEIKENCSTCIIQGIQDLTLENIQRNENNYNQAINSSPIRHENEIDDENDKTQDKTPTKRIPQFAKMHRQFQLNRVINPIKFLVKNTITEYYQDNLKKHPFEKYSLNNSQNISKPSLSSQSHNSSSQKLLGRSTASNSSLNKFKYDSIIQSVNNSFLKSSNQNKKPKFLESRAMGIQNSLQIKMQKKRYNLPKEQPVPEFIQEIKNTILEIEELGDNPLTGLQSTQLQNSLGLLSMHKDAINSTKEVTDYQFDMSKEHFIVPQRSRQNTLNAPQVRGYGSIAMLDKLYQVNLPSVYLMQGLG